MVKIFKIEDKLIFLILKLKKKNSPLEKEHWNY